MSKKIMESKCNMYIEYQYLSFPQSDPPCFINNEPLFFGKDNFFGLYGYAEKRKKLCQGDKCQIREKVE